MKPAIFIVLLLFSVAGFTSPAGIFKTEVKAPMEKTYKAVYKALEDKNFWVIFEVNIGENLNSFSKRWGEDYNRNHLEGIRSMVICNGWHANRVSNAHPDLMALCPLRVNLVYKDGVTRVLFARPTAAAEGSPGIEIIREIEGIVIGAIRKGVDSVRQP